MKTAIVMNPSVQPTPFERWFVQCLALAINNDLGPDDYLWNMESPGIWGELEAAGLTPEEAVLSQFCKQ
jgi:hypothetical protein